MELHQRMPQDFLGKDCTLLEGATLEDFKLQFCDRCLNGECVRSIAGTSQFEKRVITWQERLFTDVPRMDSKDERFDGIHAKQFVEVHTGSIPEVGQSAWVDPRNLDEPPERTHKEEAPPAEPAIVEPMPIPSPPALVSPPPPALVSPQAVNTPHRPRQMMKGTPKPVVDPWEVKGEPAGEGEIVNPGTRIRFGR